MSLLNVFKLSYYFDAFSGSVFTGFWWGFGALVTVFLVTFLLGLKWGRDKTATGRVKEVRGAWLSIGYTLGVVGLLWLFFRYQGIPYLNWRLWPAALIVVTVVRAVLMWREANRLRKIKASSSSATGQISAAEYTRRRQQKQKH